MALKPTGSASAGGGSGQSRPTRSVPTPSHGLPYGNSGGVKGGDKREKKVPITYGPPPKSPT
jgi:hypothetical protein